MIVPVIVEVLTDNHNRTAPEIRVLFKKGQLGVAGEITREIGGGPEVGDQVNGLAGPGRDARQLALADRPLVSRSGRGVAGQLVLAAAPLVN